MIKFYILIIRFVLFFQSSENLNSISKLQTYLTKVDILCQLIGNDNVNIDQALIMYQKKIEHDNDVIEKSNSFIRIGIKISFSLYCV